MPVLAECDRDALADIMRAASLAQAFLGDQDLDAFTADLKTQAAILHELMIVGEGVKRLSEAARAAYPDVPWRLIAGMRERLIHQYHTVDLEEVWRTVVTDLPVLMRRLEAIMMEQEQS